MMEKKARQIVERLLMLSRRGEPGEREAAAKKLSAACKKYGIDVRDLEAEVLGSRTVEFKFHTPLEKRIAVQIAAMVLDETEVTLIRPGRATKRMKVTLPVKKAVEFEVLYTAYLAAWNREVDALLYAFIDKNKIYPPNGESSEIADLSPEEKERVMKARRFIDGVDIANVRGQIGGDAG